MKITKVFFIILFFTTSIKSQYNLQKQFELAESLYKSGNYYDAITEYKRLLFFDKGNEHRFKANYKIALAYKHGAKTEGAIKYFNVAIEQTDNPQKIFECQTEIIRILILSRDTKKALEEISKLKEATTDSTQIEELNYWKGWTFIFQNDWEEAGKTFSKYKGNTELIKICDYVENKKYSVSFAKVISYFLPGAGQFYTGNYLSGTMSLIWNALLGYYTITAFAEDRILDGLVIFNLGWFRFYRGNYTNADKFAKEKNIKIYNKQLEYLQNKYTGKKP